MALVGEHTTYLLNSIGGSAGGHVPEPWPAILPCLSHDTLLCRVSLDLPTMRARRQMARALHQLAPCTKRPRAPASDAIRMRERMMPTSRIEAGIRRSRIVASPHLESPHQVWACLQGAAKGGGCRALCNPPTIKARACRGRKRRQGGGRTKKRDLEKVEDRWRMSKGDIGKELVEVLLQLPAALEDEVGGELPHVALARQKRYAPPVQIPPPS